MTAMLRSTPARIGVGRAGTRYRTNTLLRFRADHAAAKDAVISEVDDEAVAQLGLVELTTRAADKRIFLAAPRRRPRALRRGARRARREVRRAPQRWCCLRRRPVGGGDQRAPRSVPRRAHAALAARGFAPRAAVLRAPLARQGDGRDRASRRRRVLRLHLRRAPRASASPIRSRAYYIYRPAAGATDADREVISNINPRGLAPARRRAMSPKRSSASCATRNRASSWRDEAERPGRPPLKPRVLAVRTIPDAPRRSGRGAGAARRAARARPDHRTSDDALYVALDEGTKAAPAEVVYASSFYAGAGTRRGRCRASASASTPARDPDEIAPRWTRASLPRGGSVVLRSPPTTRQALAFFPHVVRRPGRYLAPQAGIAVGAPMAYLIAPPLESIVGLDAALKAAAVRWRSGSARRRRPTSAAAISSAICRPARRRRARSPRPSSTSRARRCARRVRRAAPARRSARAPRDGRGRRRRRQVPRARDRRAAHRQARAPDPSGRRRVAGAQDPPAHRRARQARPAAVGRCSTRRSPPTPTARARWSASWARSSSWRARSSAPK